MAPVRIDPTPNPNSRKITFPSAIVARPVTYASADLARENPLAAALFLPGIQSVFLLNNFATVTKAASADWGTLEPALRAAAEKASP